MAGFPLPSPGTEAREALGDLAYVADILSPAKRGNLPTLDEARRSARAFFEGEAAARWVYRIIMLADDSIVLMRFGPLGGRKLLWTFREGSGS